MDKTMLDIMSITFGFVGLIGSITKFSYSESRKTYYGENILGVKGDIIDEFIVWIFSFLTILALLPQILHLIFVLNIAERVYTSTTYLLFSIICLATSILLIPVFKIVAIRISKIRWFPIIIEKTTENYLTALKYYDNIGCIREDKTSEINQNMVDKNFTAASDIVDFIEKILEIDDKNGDLKTRINRLETLYDK
jgi:hypothetical protein